MPLNNNISRLKEREQLILSCLYIIHVSERRQQLNRRKSPVVFDVNRPTKTDYEDLKGKTKAFVVDKVFIMYVISLTY